MGGVIYQGLYRATTEEWGISWGLSREVLEEGIASRDESLPLGAPCLLAIAWDRMTIEQWNRRLFGEKCWIARPNDRRKWFDEDLT